MKTTSIELREAAGMEREPTMEFIRTPCWRKVVVVWHMEAEYKMHVSQIGTMRRRILTSSTWVTVQESHVVAGTGSVEYGSAIITALSKQLHQEGET